MKKASLFISLILVSVLAYTQDINMDSNQKARLYFTEAEKRFRQNDYKTALEYIKKAENELPETNGRILNLKVKVLYNDGKFNQAQSALAQFVNNYSNTVTPEIKAETESYFLKLERYFEKKQEEEDRKANEERQKEESLKHYKYVSCPNSSCSYGKVDEHYRVDCYTCDGSGRITKYDYAKAFANGLNGTNNNTAYKVTCSKCDGSGRLKKTKKVKCQTCHGENKILKYSGSTYVSSDDRDYAIKYKRKQIDYYIDLKSEISKKSSQKIFPMKDFSTGKYGLCNRNLKLIIPYRYDKAKTISSNIAIVTANSKSGLVNSENNIILPLEYSEIRRLSSSSLLVKKSNSLYLSDYKGNPKGESVDRYAAYGDFLMVYNKDGKYGVMDFNGNIIEPPSYIDYEVINWNPFLVSFKTGYDWQLKKLTTSVSDLYKESFNEIKKYSSGSRSVVLLKGAKSKLARLNGTLISNEGFSEIDYNEQLGIFKLKQDYQCGLYDVSNDSYIYPKYSNLYLNKDNPQRALVVKNGMYGVINTQGKNIIPIIKTRIWFNTGKNRFIVQEKEKSRKRLVYDTNGKYLYDYKDK